MKNNTMNKNVENKKEILRDCWIKLGKLKIV